MVVGDIVQIAPPSAGDGNSATVVFGAAVTPGNTVVIATFFRNEESSITIQSDPGFVVDLDQPVEQLNGSARRYTKVFSYDTTGDPDPSEQWVVQYGSSVRQVTIALEIEGAFEKDVSAPNDSADAQVSSLSTGTTDPTATAVERVLAFLGTRHGTPGAVAWTNSFVVEENGSSGSGANHAFMEIASLLTSTTGTQESTASWSNAEEASNAIIAYKEKGAGGTAILKQEGESAEATEVGQTALTLLRISDEVSEEPEVEVFLRDLLRLQGDALQLPDASQRLRGVFRVVDEVATADESPESYRGMFRVVDESENTSEAVETYRGVFQIQAESSQLDEVTFRMLGLISMVTEVTESGESALVVRNLLHQVLEGESLVEVEAYLRSLQRTQLDQTTVVETDAAHRELVRRAEEVLDEVESDSIFRGVYQQVDELEPLSEVRLRYKGLVELATDLLDLDEEAVRHRGFVRVANEDLQSQEADDYVIVFVGTEPPVFYLVTTSAKDLEHTSRSKDMTHDARTKLGPQSSTVEGEPWPP